MMENWIVLSLFFNRGAPSRAQVFFDHGKWDYHKILFETHGVLRHF
jgi:hypothetical protein